jgi:hypothetical protein
MDMGKGIIAFSREKDLAGPNLVKLQAVSPVNVRQAQGYKTHAGPGHHLFQVLFGFELGLSITGHGRSARFLIDRFGGIPYRPANCRQTQSF